MAVKVAGWTASIIALVLLAAIGWGIYVKVGEALQPVEARAEAEAGPVPVAVAEMGRGVIEDRRVFSGTLEAQASFTVAPKVSGRIEWMAAQIGDPVKRGELIARLDDDEFAQDVAQAEASLAVAEANEAQAVSSLEITQRTFERTQTLSERGVASESQLDVVGADLLSKRAAVEVARANVRRSESLLESAKIRLGYTQVVAAWPDGDEERVVSERHVDAGNTVGANSPLVSVIETDPLLAVVFVTERDYGRLRVGQGATLTTDAHVGREFEAEIVRFAPVFRAASRQARVELSVPNPGRLLKPGMFVRVAVVLERLEDAVTVPADALVQRNEKDWVFVVDEGGETVRQVEVEIGIRSGDMVQVTGRGADGRGRVVTLGQQLLMDGTEITIPSDAGVDSAGDEVSPAEPLAIEGSSEGSG